MTLTGGCYCGALRYEIIGEIPMRGLCLCRTCQKISGGAGNLFLGIEAKAFRYTRGVPGSFSRGGPDDPPIREFCSTCGVHIAARSPKLPDGLIVKVGTLDEPAEFGGPDAIYWTREKQPFHVVPDGVASFDTLPGRP